MSDVVGRLDIELSANTAEFIAAFRSAAEASGHFKNDVSENLRAIKLAAADLNAELASGNISHSDEINARRNILSLLKQTLDTAKAEGIERRGNLSIVKQLTAEIEKQNAGLEGTKGKLATITSQILNAIKLRASGIPGLGGFGGALAIRAYEPIGKIAEEGAGKLEATFGSAALAIGGTAAALAGVALIAGEVTHHMMDLAQSIENTAAATGLTTTQVQELSEAAKLMGVDAGSLEMAFSRIDAQIGEFITSGKAAGEGSEFFAKVMHQMGVSMSDATGNARSANDVLGDFYNALQQIHDPATRTALEMEALGTRGRVIAEIFEEARRKGMSYDDMLKQIDASGNVLDSGQIAMLLEAKEKWDAVKESASGYWKQLEVIIDTATLHPLITAKNLIEFGGAGMATAEMEAAPNAGKEEQAKNESALILKIIAGNELLDKRVAILRAGGEMQLQLNQAEAAYNAALAAAAIDMMKGNVDSARQKQSEIDLYAHEIAQIKEILALEQKKGDLTKLQNELDAAAQAYTVAAVEGNRSITAEKAKQIALYSKEIESLQKTLGLLKETASLAKFTPPVANVVKQPSQFSEERVAGEAPAPGAISSGLLPPEAYLNAGKKLRDFLAAPSIPSAQGPAAAPPIADLSSLIGDSSAEMLSKSGQAMDQLRDKWLESTGQTIPLIEEQYEKDLENFQLMFEMKKITAQQFAEAQVELEQMANQQLKSAWDERVAQFGTVAERMRALEQQIADESKNFSGKVFDTMTRAVDGVEDALARLVVTGRSSFRQLLEGITEEMAKNSIQLGFSKIFEELGKHSKTQPPTVGGPADMGPDQHGGWAAAMKKLFGGGSSEHAKAGTKTNPLYVVPIGGGIGGGIPSLSDMNRGTNAAPGAGWLSPFKKTVSALSVPGAPTSAPEPGWMSALGIGGPTNIPPPPGGSSASGFASLFSSFLGSKKSSGDEEDDGSGGLLGMFSGGSGKSSSNGLLGMFGSMFSSSSSETTGFLSMIPKFAGFLAEGGDVTPGKAYVVGEKHPEIFFPGKSGRVEPFMTMAPPSRPNVTAVVNVHGVENADSFRRSSSQIMAHLHAQASAAAMKNK